MNENKVDAVNGEQKKQNLLRKMFGKAKLRALSMAMVLSSLLSLSAFAADGETTSGGFSAVIGSFDTISALLGQVFVLMTSNALLALFLGISLIGAVIGLFVGLKHAARR